jgi:alkylated DNA repair dioxygenase AlkB
MEGQLNFFDPGPKTPDGFKYQSEVITAEAESRLIEQIRGLPFRDFEFHGFTGKRRVVSFGWRYDFNERVLQKTEDIPPFLFPVRALAARFAGLEEEVLRHILVTEYSAGAAIGWHRDKAVFGEVIGVSLLASCVFRLRRKAGEKWERTSIVAEPRSMYLLSGPSRTEWEHSIPPVAALRYSITLRALRGKLNDEPERANRNGSPFQGFL